MVKDSSRSSLPARQAIVALGLAGACAIGMVVAPGESRAALDKDTRRQLMRRTVFVLAIMNDNGKPTPYSRGSGTILTPDGAVLTNRHVIWYEQGKRPADMIAIGLTTNFAERPELKCLADPRHAVIRDELDLALLKCETDMQGKPWQPSDWPVAQIGSSEDLEPGDTLIVIGYPAVGGWTINYTAGTVSGFMGKDDGAGRFWLKTDTEIGSGNSGGTALNEAGQLVGVPTAVSSGRESANGRVGLVRPIELARDLIDLARSGWQPGGGGGQQPGQGGFGAKNGPQRPQPQANGVTVIGQIKAVEDSRPIRDATVVILKPGIAVRDINKDRLADQVLTLGQTDANGRFQTATPVPRGQVYSVIVIAEGYEPLVEDGVLKIDNQASDPFDPWGTITLKRS